MFICYKSIEFLDLPSMVNIKRSTFYQPPNLNSVQDKQLWIEIVKFMSSHSIWQYAAELGVLPQIFISRCQKFLRMRPQHHDPVNTALFRRVRSIAFAYLLSIKDFDSDSAMMKLGEMISDNSLSDELRQFAKHTYDNINRFGPETQNQILRSIHFIKDQKAIIEIMTDSMNAYEGSPVKFYNDPPLDYSCPPGISDRFLDHVYLVCSSEYKTDVMKEYAAHHFSSYYDGNTPGKLLISALLHLSSDLAEYSNITDEDISKIIEKASNVKEFELARFLRMSEHQMSFVLFRCEGIAGLKNVLESYLHMICDEGMGAVNEIEFDLSKLDALIAQEELKHDELACRVLQQWHSNNPDNRHKANNKLCVFITSRNLIKITKLLISPKDTDELSINKQVVRCLVHASSLTFDSQISLMSQLEYELGQLEIIDDNFIEYAAMLLLSIDCVAHNQKINNNNIMQSVVSRFNYQMTCFLKDDVIIQLKPYFTSTEEFARVITIRANSLIHRLARQVGSRTVNLNVLIKERSWSLLAHGYLSGIYTNIASFTEFNTNLKKDFSSALCKFIFDNSTHQSINDILYIRGLNRLNENAQVNNPLKNLLALDDETVSYIFDDTCALYLLAYQKNISDKARMSILTIFEKLTNEEFNLLAERAVKLKSPLTVILKLFVTQIQESYLDINPNIKLIDFIVPNHFSVMSTILGFMTMIDEECIIKERYQLLGNVIINQSINSNLFLIEIFSEVRMKDPHAIILLEMIIPTLTRDEWNHAYATAHPYQLTRWNHAYATAHPYQLTSVAQRFFVYSTKSLLEYMLDKKIHPKGCDLIQNEAVKKLEAMNLYKSGRRQGTTFTLENFSLVSMIILLSPSHRAYKVNKLIITFGEDALRVDKHRHTELHHLCGFKSQYLKNDLDSIVHSLLIAGLGTKQDMNGMHALDYAIDNLSLSVVTAMIKIRPDIALLKNNNVLNAYDVLFEKLISYDELSFNQQSDLMRILESLIPKETTVDRDGYAREFIKKRGPSLQESIFELLERLTKDSATSLISVIALSNAYVQLLRFLHDTAESYYPIGSGRVLNALEYCFFSVFLHAYAFDIHHSTFLNDTSKYMNKLIEMIDQPSAKIELLERSVKWIKRFMMMRTENISISLNRQIASDNVTLWFKVLNSYLFNLISHCSDALQSDPMYTILDLCFLQIDFEDPDLGIAAMYTTNIVIDELSQHGVDIAAKQDICSPEAAIFNIIHRDAYWVDSFVSFFKKIINKDNVDKLYSVLNKQITDGSDLESVTEYESIPFILIEQMTLLFKTLKHYKAAEEANQSQSQLLLVLELFIYCINDLKSDPHMVTSKDIYSEEKPDNKYYTMQKSVCDKFQEFVDSNLTEFNHFPSICDKITEVKAVLGEKKMRKRTLNQMKESDTNLTVPQSLSFFGTAHSRNDSSADESPLKRVHY